MKKSATSEGPKNKSPRFTIVISPALMAKLPESYAERSSLMRRLLAGYFGDEKLAEVRRPGRPKVI